MATAEDIATLRRYVNEPTQTPYTDAALGLRIDAASSLSFLAREIWLEKAASYAGLVDMQEGSSRRSLSQLRENALSMAASFGEGGTLLPTADAGRRTVLRDIERA